MCWTESLLKKLTRNYAQIPRSFFLFLFFSISLKLTTVRRSRRRTAAVTDPRKLDCELSEESKEAWHACEPTYRVFRAWYSLQVRFEGTSRDATCPVIIPYARKGIPPSYQPGRHCALPLKFRWICPIRSAPRSWFNKRSSSPRENISLDGDFISSGKRMANALLKENFRL